MSEKLSETLESLNLPYQANRAAKLEYDLTTAKREGDISERNYQTAHACMLLVSKERNKLRVDLTRQQGTASGMLETNRKY